MNTLHCPYCSEPAKLVTGQDVFSHRPDLFHKWFWECIACDAYVGCHPNSKVPLGNLANSETRKARSKVHAILDPIWKTGIKTRSGTYAWLAAHMEIAQTDCHVALFDISMCERAVRICEGYFESIKRQGKSRKHHMLQHGLPYKGTVTGRLSASEPNNSSKPYSVSVLDLDFTEVERRV